MLGGGACAVLVLCTPCIWDACIAPVELAAACGDMRRPIGINLSPTSGFRRGEGGCVDVGRAFMVARVLFPWLTLWRNTVARPLSLAYSSPLASSSERPTTKAHPAAPHHPRLHKI